MAFFVLEFNPLRILGLIFSEQTLLNKEFTSPKYVNYTTFLKSYVT